MSTNFEKLAVHLPKILLPSQNVDKTKWAVIACDQYTSQPEVWSEIEKTTSGKPSTLHLMLPEVYLNNKDKPQRIQHINKTMKEYFEKKVFVETKPEFIYVERSLDNGTIRKGLMISIDLEKFNFSKDSKTLVRPTEGTIIDRIPPRLEIRKNASVELPHVMLLIDDPNRTVIEPLKKQVSKNDLVYDFELMIKNHRLTGYKIDQSNLIKQVTENLEKLIDPKLSQKRYDLTDEFMEKNYKPLLFAVGDGNHSLCTAKVHWDNIKKNLKTDKEKREHPARYALCEVVNLYDDSLKFEAIHRTLFNVENIDTFLKEMKQFYEKLDVEMKILNSEKELDEKEKQLKSKNGHFLPFYFGNKYGYFFIKNPKFNLPVASLKDFLDIYAEKNPKVEVDYIHGDQETKDLGKKPNTISFILQPINKGDFFKSIVLNGPLPRKTFSMGHAKDKRVYFECRKIMKE